jgi:hypothetical protein
MRLLAKVDPLGLEELFDNFCILAERNPSLAGVPHPENSALYVFEGPALARLPRIAFVFTVDSGDGIIRLWNCRILD